MTKSTEITLVFRALADPTRRKIIELLMASSMLTIAGLTENFNATRQAVTKHIKILEEAGIVKSKREGKTTLCMLDMRTIRSAYEWMSVYRNFWEKRFSSLGDYLKKMK
jgi:DNA-binding transcriptional ArsR family regulator